MLEEARHRLAGQQEHLMRTLSRRQSQDIGIDPAKLEAARVSLERKRSRTMERAWPALAASLGKEFDRLFEEYTNSFGAPEKGGPLADGRAFARWLSRTRSLADAARREVFLVDLQFRRCKGSLKPRRGFCVKCGYLHAANRILIGMRIPFLGVYVLG